MTAARELRIALTVADYQQCLSFYRNVIGLPLLQEWPSAEGRGALLSIPSATLEILDEGHASWVDQVEVGRRVSGPVRLAAQFQELEAVMAAAASAGATLLRGPVQMPWKDTNARLVGPDGLHLTLFKRPD